MLINGGGRVEEVFDDSRKLRCVLYDTGPVLDPQVLEDKGNLALLQRLMTVPTLDSYVVKGRAAVVRWAKSRFGCFSEEEAGGVPPSYPNHVLGSGQLQDLTVGIASESAIESGEHSEHSQPGSNWWCVKAAGGNGGMDVWVLHAGNWRSVAERLQESEKYVIQVNWLGGHRTRTPRRHTRYNLLLRWQKISSVNCST